MADRVLKQIKQFQVEIQEQRQIRLAAGKREKELKDALNQYELDVTGLSNKEVGSEEVQDEEEAPAQDEDEDEDEDFNAGSQAEEAEEGEEEEEEEEEEKLPIIKELVVKRPSPSSEQEGKRAKLSTHSSGDRAKKPKTGKVVRKQDKERG